MSQSPRQFDVSSVNGAQQRDCWRHHSSSLVCVRSVACLGFCRFQIRLITKPAKYRYPVCIECFQYLSQYLYKFIGTKGCVCIRKEFNSHRICLGHQHGRRYIVLGHQYGRRDVMWKHSINARSSQSIIIGIDESIKIGKSDLIDIDCIYQSVEKVDCKTVGFFLKISKDIGKAWRKSLTCAKRASLTRCFQPHSRPFVWLLARTWIRKNTDCFAVYRKRWHTRFILIFTDFIDLYRRIYMFIKKWKLNLCNQ